MLRYDIRDESEQVYLAKFTEQAAAHGIAINYALDRAALDLGVHLTAPMSSKMKGVTAYRVWFQFKGKATESLTSEALEKKDSISQSVEVEHLRQWYRYSEAVYVVVYVGSVDKFFAVDIQKLISERWGDRVFKDETFSKADGETADYVTIHLDKSKNEVNEEFWDSLSKHRSMRIDLGSYQGKPLGHSRDVQSGLLQMMEPSLFEDTIGQLLVGYKFRPSAIANDISPIYPDAATAGDKVTLVIGKLFEPFQYDLYLTREILPDETGFREDGQQFRAHGLCAVIIHSDAKSRPDPAGIVELGRFLKSNGIEKLLVFVNHYMTSVSKWDGQVPYNCFPEFRTVFTETGVEAVPLHLEDLGKTILLATNVYLTFREDIIWLDEVARQKIESGEFKVMTPEEYFRALENGTV